MMHRRRVSGGDPVPVGSPGLGGRGVVHVELFYSLTTNEPIRVRCDCPIGRAHSYAEWVDRFQRPAHAPAQGASPPQPPPG
jgi:hypothetical protein